MRKNTEQETGTPLLLLFAEDLSPDDLSKRLKVGSQSIPVDMTTWETVDNQDS